MLGVLARSLADEGPDLPYVQLKILSLQRADQVSLSGSSVLERIKCPERTKCT
jgi:hypothetical protein